MDALSVGIIIIVGCVVFLFISAILIYQNAQTEAKLLKKRQMKKMGRASSRGSAAAVMIAALSGRHGRASLAGLDVEQLLGQGFVLGTATEQPASLSHVSEARAAALARRLPAGAEGGARAGNAKGGAGPVGESDSGRGSSSDGDYNAGPRARHVRNGAPAAGAAGGVLASKSKAGGKKGK
ncbi:hypothetical protein BaRGS_00038611 [Batillaria attramentaria]|uniref:Uncharacterized protein n=1 Tax=Batillaria attramentaria TaxID=370345 RepID=A0ABD0J600_9CAEN